MKERPDYSAYSTVLFMDSMVALEGKPLPGLPWGRSIVQDRF
jgi:hypothetical protein